MLSPSKSKMTRAVGFFGLLVIFLIFLRHALAIDDVHLRIAERTIIPGYVRHGHEYPEIDIKRIMRERGFDLKRRFRGQQAPLATKLPKKKKVQFPFQGHDCDWQYNSIICLNTIPTKYHGPKRGIRPYPANSHLHLQQPWWF